MAMYLNIFIYSLLLRIGFAQLNGEFWWRDDKITNYNAVQKSQHQDFDAGGYENIIFKDDDIVFSGSTNIYKLFKSEKDAYNNNKWLDEGQNIFSDTTMNYNEINHMSSDERDSSNIGDKYLIKYPEIHIGSAWKSNININPINSLDTSENEVITEKKIPNNIFLLMVFPYTSHKHKSLDNSFTTLKKIDWKPNESFQSNTVNYENKEYNDLICCIIPLENKTDFGVPQINFPDELENKLENVKRLKRSDKEAQKQRSVLLKHRYQTQKDTSGTEIKIANPEYEYDDPYWNIQNVNGPNKKRLETSTIYSTKDYIEDYEAELPRPGLAGIYSDNETPHPGWTFSYTNEGSSYDEVDDYDDYDDNLSTFGYSTIDPRIDSSSRISKLPKKPARSTTVSKKTILEPETPTISYHSNPDFNVLQDFKLLNLMRAKNKNLKAFRSTTIENISDKDSKELILNDQVESVSNNNKEYQVTKACEDTTIPTALKIKGKQIGDTENGSHPWLALLVPRRNLKNILCYASLIHTRAAITAAECVHKNPESEINIIVGLWNYNVRTGTQRRAISALLHPKYKSGNLDNNLALIYWQRPLKLGLNINPVCLNKPHFGDDCIFVGWGGFDQGIKTQSRWQRATIHSCKDRLSLKGINLPNDAFCGSVRSPTTVTGLGGSLVCDVNDHVSAVGVAVSRDTTLVLLPAYDWVIEAIEVLQE